MNGKKPDWHYLISFLPFLNYFASMVRKFLLDILVDPITREKLKYDTIGDTLTTDTGNHYQVLEDVPVLIPQEIYDSEFTSSLHSANNSTFRYAEHYKIDAEVNNYFEKP